MPKLNYKNTENLMRPHAHGFNPKVLIVLHETVSKDIPGWTDVDNIDAYLAAKDYGMHGVTDAEGNIAWAHNLGKAIFWQAGGVNTMGIGIEQVSDIMLRSPDNAIRRKIWVAREKQLRATAKLVAAVSKAQNIPLVYSNSLGPGVTSHWDVSRHYPTSQGHTDCWPVHKGGYYPIGEVITLAKMYRALGFTL